VVWIHAIFSLTSVCSRFSMLSMRVSQGMGLRCHWERVPIGDSKSKRTFCFRIYPKLTGISILGDEKPVLRVLGIRLKLRLRLYHVPVH
jgi:hypothetical protein